MAEPNRPPSNSGILLSAMAGAVLGAAGLAWWLLSEAERRRLEQRQARNLRAGRLQQLREPLVGQPPQERDLHDKVHELNQAIDDVRRQLEGMGSR
jgi:uncharacterized membrane protein YccC